MPPRRRKKRIKTEDSEELSIYDDYSSEEKYEDVEKMQFNGP